MTFQPDAAAGGNVENVILQMNISDVATANPELVSVSLNYITFNNITFQESNASQHIGFSKLVLLLVSSFNVTVTGIVFDGCKFVGSAPSGTENGIELAQAVRNITVRGNVFLRLLRGISGMNTWFLEETITIEDNQFLAGYRSSSGSGNQLGSAMEVHGANVIIKRNIIDFQGSFNGGYRGIYVAVFGGSESIIVEQNSIKGTVSASLFVQGQGGSPDSFLIANNMINVVAYPVWANEPAYGLGITLNVGNAKILFNTIRLLGGGLYALRVEGENCIVKNNIVIAKPSSGFNVGYEQATSLTANIQSDYNVIFMQEVPVHL